MKSRNLAVSVAVILGSVCLHGQGVGNSNNSGTPDSAVFHGSDVDAVQTNNGSLQVSIPLTATPGRGISTGWSYVYNNKGWRITPFNGGSTNFVDPVTGNSMSWTLVGPVPSAASVSSALVRSPGCAIPGNFTVVEADGTRHHLVPDPTGTQICNFNTNVDRYADDGSGWVLKGGTTLYRKDGARMGGSLRTSGGTSHPPQVTVLTPPSIIDANGNQAYGTVNGSTTNYTDSLGRPVPSIVTTTDGSGNVISQQIPYYDANGVLRNIQVQMVAISVATHLCPPNITCTEYSGTWHVPQTITLANGLSYSFSYDPSTGELTGMTLPTGASISYEYAEQFYDSSNPDVGGRRVTGRTVTVGGQARKWNYSYTLSSSPATTTVIDPLENQLIYQCAYLSAGLPWMAVYDNYDTPPCYTTEVDSYSGNGGGAQLMKKVQTEYWTAEIIKPKAVSTTVYSTVSGDSSVLKSRVETDYNSFSVTILGISANATFGNVVENREFSYDSSGNNQVLVRRTHFTYLSDSSPQYLNINMNDRVTDRAVYDCVAQACTPGTAGSYGTPYSGGQLISETQYAYDDTAVANVDNLAAPPASVPGHDDADYGTGYTLRGNPTHVKSWLNTANTWLPTANTYDVLGNLVSTTDPGNHTTTFKHSDDWNGWNVTAACLPATNSYAFLTDAMNALSQHGHTTYFPCSGQAQTTQDQNDINAQRSGTTYTYDAMKRTLTKSFADGGQISYSYSDSLSDLSATETTKITGSVNHVVKTSLDGLGRVVKTALLSDPDGATYTDITYDEVGRKKTVSNPYRSTSDSTYGVTTYFYDALGRVTTTAPPDGSQTANNITTQFGGNYTVSTDQAGNQRRRFFDSLGRVTEVDEPGDSFAGTQAGGSLAISGTLQSTTIAGQSGSTASGSVKISGTEQRQPVDPTCTIRCQFIYDAGTVTITVNGFAKKVSFGQGSNMYQIATDLANAFNTDGASPVSASTGGTNTVTLTSYAASSAANYPLSSSYTWDSGDFTNSSFTTSNSGTTLTGGTDAVNPTTIYDAGTVTVSIGSFSASASFSQSGNSTASAVASTLASALSVSNSPVTASASGSNISITYKTVGTAGNVAVSCSSSTSQGAYFNSPSFTCPATMALSGGQDPSAPSLSNNYYVTLYTYDALNNLVHVEQHGDVTDATKWRPRNFTYDSLSRLTQSNNPETGTINFNYDADSNLITKVSPQPNQTNPSVRLTINYAYDALHRHTGMTYSNGDPAVTYFYDQTSYNGLTVTNGIGRHTGMSDGSGATAWSFDSEGRARNERRTIGTVTKSIGYTYNLEGSLASILYPSGSTVTYTPAASGSNSAGRVGMVQDTGNGINYVTGSAGPGSFATYAADGSVATFVNSYGAGFAGITSSFSYNNRLQPVTIQATSPTATVFNVGYDFHLGNGDNGNVYQLTNGKDNTRSQIFTYDALNRISSAKTSASSLWGDNYIYDPWGNLVQKNPMAGMGGENFAQVGLTNNQLTGFSYDAAGNTTSDGINTYTYDGENRIVSAAGVTYTYDGAGQRVKKSSGRLYWFGALEESDLTGNLTAEYVLVGGQRLARRDLPSGTVHYYFSDHLKSVSLVTNASGGIEEESDYYPGGGERVITHTLADQHYKFNGKERDSETGFDDFGARFYSSAWGRWLTPDWSADPTPVPYAQFDNPQSLNLYAYARNNPTTFSDLDGHEPGSGNVQCLGGEGHCADIETPSDADTQLRTWMDETKAELASMGAKGLSSDGYQATGTQQAPQTQNLSGHDIAQIIKSAKASSSDPVATAINVFNNLGQNVTATGDALRAGMKEANFSMPDPLSSMVAKATSISKSGDQVTIQSSDDKQKYKIGSDTIRVDKTVQFTVQVRKGTAAIIGISGLKADAGFRWIDFHNVRYTSTGPNTGKLDIDVGILHQHKTCTIDGCK